jgi:hypothetical protein
METTFSSKSGPFPGSFNRILRYYSSGFFMKSHQRVHQETSRRQSYGTVRSLVLHYGLLITTILSLQMWRQVWSTCTPWKLYGDLKGVSTRPDRYIVESTLDSGVVPRMRQLDLGGRSAER